MPASRTSYLALALAAAALSGSASAAITLQNATATYSQNFGGGVAATIDGSLTAGNGWAIYDFDDSPTNAQTAAYETAPGTVADNAFVITLSNLDSGNVQHTVGKFRISVTTDDRGDFADGLASGGDVTANWTQLVPLTATATNGTTLTRDLTDNTVLAGGDNPTTSVYTITAANPLGSAITGFRLETFEDGTLPDSGPGRAGNGNYVLTEFQVDSVPEPGVAIPLAGAAIAMVRGRRGRTL